MEEQAKFGPEKPDMPERYMSIVIHNDMLNIGFSKNIDETFWEAVAQTAFEREKQGDKTMLLLLFTMTYHVFVQLILHSPQMAKLIHETIKKAVFKPKGDKENELKSNTKSFHQTFKTLFKQ